MRELNQEERRILKEVKNSVDAYIFALAYMEQGGIGCEVEFFCYAASGESLIALLPEDHDIPEKGLDHCDPIVIRYKETLKKHAQFCPTFELLEEGMNTALDELKAYAKLPYRERYDDYEESLSLIDNIDEILLVACAAHRVGKLTEEDVAKLSSMAEAVITDQEIWVNLELLFDYVEHRTGVLVYDVAYVHHFRLWEHLAAYSDSRMKLNYILKKLFEHKDKTSK
jgi:hypothetical protein